MPFIEPESATNVFKCVACHSVSRDGNVIAFAVYNEHGEFQAYAQVTERIPSGTVWMRDGWEGLNRLTSGAPAIPDEAVDLFHFSAGQAAFDARVEVAPA